MEENMDNKLKIALKCTKYLLVAVLFALPFIGPKETEARAEAEYTQTEGTDGRCPTGKVSICYDWPGQCPVGGTTCLMDEIVVEG